MPKHAERVSLLFDAHQVDRLPDDFGRVLASHLLGSTPEAGEQVALPGWPAAVVDEVEPKGGEIVPGTVLDIFIPPPPAQGPLSLVALVDASLTMGKGDPSPFEEAATVLDHILLHGRAFLERAGIVVQGGKTRQVDALVAPEELSGATILKVTPKGTFDLAQGLDESLGLLAASAQGPRVALVLSDGRSPVRDVDALVRSAKRAGVHVVALTHTSDARLNQLCRATGGEAFLTDQEAFAYLARLAGTEAEWSAPARPDPAQQGPYEFEVVIEAMED